ncbi:MAG: hypothetical protein JST79_05435 [Acidobacteria bacterium]|nr:hypothetical protein [Acidobacteriota bacterium]
MKTDWQKTLLLLVIAFSLAALAAHSYIAPPPVMAQSSDSPYYIEPGTSVLRAPDGSRQVVGKVIIDLRNGNIWGFPTLQQEPYPATGAKTSPVTSHPFLLGRYALTDMEKSEASSSE